MSNRPLPQLEHFIERGMTQNRSIGLSIAIVERGEIVYTKGFGVKALDTQEKISDDTLMMIGSTTKPLTAMLMAKMVEEGFFNWQDKVQSLYPSFELNDKAFSKTITLAQLLNAKSGMPRLDLSFFLSKYPHSAQTLFKKIAHCSPTYTDNIPFQYNNHMVSCAGYLAGSLLYPALPMEEAYAKCMQEKLFSKMNMTRTTFSHDKAYQDPNHALPHGQDIWGNPQRVPCENERAMAYLAPSGGAWSTVLDLAQFMLTEINEGVTPEGVSLLKANNCLARRQPQVKVNGSEDYGLCWFVQNDNGLKRIHHAGRTMGFSSFFSFMPEKKSGVILLSNCVNDVILHEAIHRKWLELWFGRDEQAEHTLTLSLAEKHNQIDQFKAQKIDPTFLAQFVGAYQNDEIADFHIKQMNEDFILHTNGFSTPLSNTTSAQGEMVIIGLSPPWTWMGLSLIPQDHHGGSFLLSLRNEHYLFKRKS